jgi:hypothetical protein
MAIKNTIHYQITGDLQADFGLTVTNPIIKIGVNSTQADVDGMLRCDYNVYVDVTSYNNGYLPFKAYVDGNRLKDFKYPIAEVPTWGVQTFKELQKKIIGDTFGIPIENIALVEEV